MTTKFSFGVVGAAALAACALSGAAQAADLPSRRAPPVFAPPPPIPAFSWTGFYIGVNGGYGFGGSSNASYSEYASAIGAVDFYTPLIGPKLNGGFGGGQVGYNYQINNFVIGIEADGEGSGITASNVVVDPYFGQAVAIGTRSRVGVFGSARGRIGVTFDRALFYATGGYAYGDIRTSQIINYADGFGSYASRNGFKSGYAVGGGVEYAFTNNFSVKGEYQYYDFGSRSLVAQQFAAGLAQPFTSYGHVRENFSTVRVGLNYKFDTFAPAPVVARY